VAAVQTPGPASTPAVRARGVERTFSLPTGPVRALRAVDLEVGAAGLTVLTGRSGCGKTTLLGLVAGADVADAGVVEVWGSDIARLSAARRRRLRRHTLGIALARPSDNLVERLDVAANVRLAARLRGAPVELDAVLSPVALASRGTARIDALSGGEQQRLAIALALVGSPRLVILDEPTAELDARTSGAMVEYLCLRARDRAVLVASHDPRVVEAADSIVVLEAGRRVA
jgi:putative ABC transport system ATP-binding protein